MLAWISGLPDALRINTIWKGMLAMLVFIPGKSPLLSTHMSQLSSSIFNHALLTQLPGCVITSWGYYRMRLVWSVGRGFRRRAFLDRVLLHGDHGLWAGQPVNSMVALHGEARRARQSVLPPVSTQAEPTAARARQGR